MGEQGGDSVFDLLVTLSYHKMYISFAFACSSEPISSNHVCPRQREAGVLHQTENNTACKVHAS